MTELEQKLLDALKNTAQALAWQCFGECRGFSEALLSPGLAAKDARAVIEEAEYARAEPVSARLLEALRSTVDLLWLEDSHSVQFDDTVMFGMGYDFSGLRGGRRSEFLWPDFDCVVWPSGAPNGKWSAYCTYEGSMWFEKFDTEDQAHEQCLRLLDRVKPEHPVSKARAAIAAAEAQQAEPVRLREESGIDSKRIDFLADSGTWVGDWTTYNDEIVSGENLNDATREGLRAAIDAEMRANGYKVEE